MGKKLGKKLHIWAIVLLPVLASCHTNKAEEHAQNAKQMEAVCDSGAAPVARTEAAKPAVAHFGADMKLAEKDAVPAAKVFASPADYRDKYVRVTGTVTDVCSKRGCWLRVAGNGAKSGAENIFIKFRDPPAGRLIPMDAVGKNVTVEGMLKQGMMSEAAARHFKQDAGAPPEEIERIVGPQKQWVITAPAVAIEGVQAPSADAVKAE